MIHDPWECCTQHRVYRYRVGTKESLLADGISSLFVNQNYFNVSYGRQIKYSSRNWPETFKKVFVVDFYLVTKLEFSTKMSSWWRHSGAEKKLLRDAETFTL